MDVQIVEISCYTCGVSFWVTENHNKELLRCHNSFYCPNGHRQHYLGETEAEKYKRIAEQKETLLNNAENERTYLANSNRALRGVITRMKKGGEI